MSFFDQNDPGDRLIMDYHSGWEPDWSLWNPETHVFCQDIGTILSIDDNYLDSLIDIMRDSLVIISNNCKERWQWCWDDTNVFGNELPMFPGSTISPQGRTPSPPSIDYRRYLWISFDSADDAMLVKMIIGNLKKGNDVNGGSVSDCTSGI